MVDLLDVSGSLKALRVGGWIEWFGDVQAIAVGDVAEIPRQERDVDTTARQGVRHLEGAPEKADGMVLVDSAAAGHEEQGIDFGDFRQGSAGTGDGQTSIHRGVAKALVKVLMVLMFEPIMLRCRANM